MILWSVFFLICLGLGYPTLNRYDPQRIEGITDSRSYVALVDPARALPIVELEEHRRSPQTQPDPLRGTHRSYRVLVPLLAGPVYRAVEGRLGSWDPIRFSLLVSTSLFVASGALGIVLLGAGAGLGGAIGLLAACLYLLDFWVPNFYLAGLVDGAEGALLVLMLVALQAGRWWWLVPVGVLGALSKETFVPLAGAMAASWWLASRREEGLSRARVGWIAAMVLCGLLAVGVVRAHLGPSHASPLSMVHDLAAPAGGLAGRAWGQIAGAPFWYGLVWLLPLALPGMRSVPSRLTIACSTGAGLAFALGAYHGAGPGNIARPIFGCLAPALSLGAAVTLSRLMRD